MSANLVVDLANTCDYDVSLRVISGDSTVVGLVVDLLGANTFCNVWAAGNNSGPLPILIQTSDTTTSGDFTDPTSGLVQMPVNISSGGIFWVNSGLWSSGYSSPAPSVNNAPVFCSGGIQFGAFQRPQRYARLICTSGNASLTAVPFIAGFVSQRKVTGSGGGFSYSPLSGSVNV
jgi:hypothetical protein